MCVSDLEYALFGDILSSGSSGEDAGHTRHSSWEDIFHHDSDTEEDKQASVLLSQSESNTQMG